MATNEIKANNALRLIALSTTDSSIAVLCLDVLEESKGEAKSKLSETCYADQMEDLRAAVLAQFSAEVTVNTYLDGDNAPFVLQLTLNWPDSLPANKIDFALIATNSGHSFMCLFTYGTLGPKLVYSENCHSCLAKDLKHTNEVKITELAQVNDEKRVYTCELKHCFD